MTRPILFRSHITHGTRSGNSEMMMRSRGSDWSHLRPYTDTDDIRDIAWKKSGTGGLSVRVRQTEGNYSIISCLCPTLYDGFYTEHHTHTREDMIGEITNAINRSTLTLGYRYENYQNIATLIQKKPKNTIIFISGVEVTRDLSQLAHHNDVIYLDIIHPYELDPTPDILFSGSVIDRERYIEDYRCQKKILKYALKKIKASYIPISTQGDTTNTLNTFFKYRYTYESSHITGNTPLSMTHS